LPLGRHRKKKLATHLNVCETRLGCRSSWELNSHVIGCSKLEHKLPWLHTTRLLDFT
jgi:hypothetical protein